jgi:integrase/recombinase XerD
MSPGDYSKIRKQLPPNHRLILDIGYFTGERWGAIVQLRVSDLYQQDGRTPLDEITYRAKTRKASPTGERKTRTIHIHSQLRDILSSYHPPRNGWLFPAGNDPTRHISLDVASHALSRAIARAGLSHKGFSTHSTRRTMITNLVNRGVGLTTVQAITGHRSIQVLQGYVENDPNTVRRAIESI